MWLLARNDKGHCLNWNPTRRVVTGPICVYCAARFAVAALLGQPPRPEGCDLYPDGGDGIRALSREECALLICGLPPVELRAFAVWLFSDREGGMAEGPCECDDRPPLAAEAN